MELLPLLSLLSHLAATVATTNALLSMRRPYDYARVGTTSNLAADPHTALPPSPPPPFLLLQTVEARKLLKELIESENDNKRDAFRLAAFQKQEYS